jgi:uncharacterized alpha-E superfamily protein
VLSRTADAACWMSRYVERAENVARLVDVSLSLALDLAPRGRDFWKPVVATTGDLLRFLDRAPETTRETALEFLAFDEQNPNSLVSCLRAARENARSVRQVLSTDLWEHLNSAALDFAGPAARERAAADPHAFFRDVRLSGRLFEALTDDTLSHGELWHFCRLGRHQERADKTARILDVRSYLHLADEADADLEWSAVLRSTSALELYRRRHGRFQEDRVVDFLLLDREFPRSVHHNLIGLEETLHAISGSPRGTFANPAEQLAGQLRSDLAYASARDVLAEGLHDYLDRLQYRLNVLGDAVAESFFGFKPVSAR